MTVLYAALIYAIIGLCIAIFFVSAGVARVLEPPRPVSLGARLLILPGAAVLWPLVLVTWLGLGGRA